MDIAQIHVGSYATRIAQVASSELAAWLQEDIDLVVPLETWFDPSRPNPLDADGEDHEAAERQRILEAMGEYVCARRIEVGETLYRHAVGQGLVRDQGSWASLPFSQRQPWETFVSTCRAVYADLIAAQLATVDARRQALAEAPALKREDSIFEEEESLGTLIPEAVAALKLSPSYQRTHDSQLQAARQRIADVIAFKGADLKKFDHDGDGRPGGSKPRALSAGEAPARAPVNRGGRGRKKGA